MTPVIQKEPLIKGVFHVEQAKEILTTLFRSKIKMHSMSSFSNLIRNGAESEDDNRRKEELVESLERIRVLLNSEEAKSKFIKINCQVEIALVNK